MSGNATPVEPRPNRINSVKWLSRPVAHNPGDPGSADSRRTTTEAGVRQVEQERR